MFIPVILQLLRAVTTNFCVPTRRNVFLCAGYVTTKMTARVTGRMKTGLCVTVCGSVESTIKILKIRTPKKLL